MNALFLWEAAQQHACTTYQALLTSAFDGSSGRQAKTGTCRLGAVRASTRPVENQTPAVRAVTSFLDSPFCAIAADLR